MNHNPEKQIHLLPGPVELREEVVREFARLPVSHRSEAFMEEFQSLRHRLCRIVGARYVELLPGSGTSANEAIAAQLSCLSGEGLILANGEFGERLVTQASRFNLRFGTMSVPWGHSFNWPEVDDFLGAHPAIEWIWAVHCETSTGILNSLDKLREISGKHHARLCLDCISSVGTVPVDLSDVYLASCSSGKAFCSYAGLSMVFYNHEIPVSQGIPKYLDLGYFRSEKGLPFTVSSNLVRSLARAAESLDSGMDGIFAGIRSKSQLLRESMHDSLFTIVNQDRESSPAVVTFQVPADLSSTKLGLELEKQRCLVSYNSRYLVNRNWIQAYITRNTSEETIRLFAGLLASYSAVR